MGAVEEEAAAAAEPRSRTTSARSGQARQLWALQQPLWAKPLAKLLARLAWARSGRRPARQQVLQPLQPEMLWAPWQPEMRWAPEL